MADSIHIEPTLNFVEVQMEDAIGVRYGWDLVLLNSDGITFEEPFEVYLAYEAIIADDEDVNQEQKDHCFQGSFHAPILQVVVTIIHELLTDDLKKDVVGFREVPGVVKVPQKVRVVIVSGAFNVPQTVLLLSNKVVVTYQGFVAFAFLLDLLIIGIISRRKVKKGRMVFHYLESF